MATPPVDMLVLDALQDDVEQLPSIMRMLGEWRQRVDGEYVQADVVDALRRLLSEGYVVALEEPLDAPELVACLDPGLLDSDLAAYWYESTPTGRAKWDSWQRTVATRLTASFAPWRSGVIPGRWPRRGLGHLVHAVRTVAAGDALLDRGSS